MHLLSRFPRLEDGAVMQFIRGQKLNMHALSSRRDQQLPKLFQSKLPLVDLNDYFTVFSDLDQAAQHRTESRLHKFPIRGLNQYFDRCFLK